MTVTAFQQANQLLREGKLEEAMVAYRQAIKQNPQFYGAYQNLGETLGKLGRWEEAVEAYRQAVELKPDAAWSSWGLSQALQQVGRLEEAQKLGDLAIEIDPKSHHQGRLVMASDAGDEALKARQKALDLKSKSASFSASKYGYANPYETWIAENEPNAEELACQIQKSKKLAYRPLMSIITPVYNTPTDILKKTIDSVIKQTYDNWQLCLVDGNSTTTGTKEVLQEWNVKEPRIKVKFLGENFGISGNSNKALELAQGEFVALLDHDDELTPFALFEVIKFLNDHPDCDVIYSDEDKIDLEGNRSDPFFKPDWSPELLRSFMYTGHLTVYRHRLVKEVGGFRSEFDFSQDYDLAWRITEISKQIAHIPKVLYHWRIIKGSAAAGDKKFARQSNLAALGSAMKRQGYKAEILKYPTANRAKIKLNEVPLVSLIIPTDNQQVLFDCLNSLLNKTRYSQLEILVVTNSNLSEKVKEQYNGFSFIKTVIFDETFNFSAKCNQGAEKALGEYLLFFNDDVRPIDEDWVESMLEMIQYEGVGDVSPKLIYENGLVQYAGMVTGVRGFVGTAFHQQPHNSTWYFNFVQSTRTVSVLSGACCLVRKSVFLKIGGWDEENTPIMGSDLDFSFKIRELGLRLVYTPFAELNHIGHLSIGAAKKQKKKLLTSDKSDLFLLKRWGKYLSYDPYYTDNMRFFLYYDSPTKYKMYATNNTLVHKSSRDILLVSHDMTWSGASLMLHTLAGCLQKSGYFVTVIAPETGALVQEYQRLNIPVVIDPLVTDSPHKLESLLKNYDLVVANTIVTYSAAIASKKMGKLVIWLIHEGFFGQELAGSNWNVQRAFIEADAIVFPSKQAESRYEKFTKRDNFTVIHYGIQLRQINHTTTKRSFPGTSPPQKIRVIQVGSIEPRKGQDTTVKAIQVLPKTLQNVFEFYFVGRTLDKPYCDELLKLTADLENVHWIGEVSPSEALRYISESDVVVCSSRDETGPIFVLEGMYFQKSIISTFVGVVPEVIEHRVNGLLFDIEDDRGLANNMVYLYQNPSLFSKFGELGFAKFEELFTVEKYGSSFTSLIERLSKDSSSNSPDSEKYTEVQRLTEAYGFLHEELEKAQVFIEHRDREIKQLKENYDILHEDRKKAQIIMEYQAREIKHLKEEYEKLVEMNKGLVAGHN
ncbi:glycosyltransferase [Planktothrix sp. FACHB-1365]|uniref:glycosyltransferase n=1 Tax=Planktothrix sp. FACHB-1365 TaxID=2692855 RepID=UPI0016880965|nr:glycosyltransferase [Planktothrix sp. FACHB-1365]MBD2484145.1 glycosyltransferase [Planktothrix sp. FACHB-1365]